MSAGTLVIGESLIDVIERSDGSVEEHVGGSPANVAVGLARLGHDVTFATMVGDDERGARIRALCAAEGVTLVAGTGSGTDSGTGTQTSVAASTVDVTGAATYSFDLSWDFTGLPAVAGGPGVRDHPSVRDMQRVPTSRGTGELPIGPGAQGMTHVHTGSLAATVEPGASAVLTAIQHARPVATISYDPNARPRLMGDAHEVRAKMEQLIGLSDVVKASDEDIAWLYDGAPIPIVMRLWGQLGPELTVVTRGDKGAVFALGPTGELTDIDAPEAEVVDTVGAGDSFMAGLLSGLLEAGLLGGVEARERLRSASLADVRPAVDRALACAAITVSRAGADPPHRAQLATP